MIASCKTAMLMTAIAGCIVLHSSRADAQWWSRAPADFEECADKAEKVAVKEARATALSECHSKFAGRRKPGGGYTYFDFMQNRSFDISGPNPTPDEQKYIDQQYTAFLDRERLSRVAASAAVRQQQLQLQQASLRNEPTDKAPSPALPASRPRAAASDARPQIKDTNCTRHSFSCEWPRLSEGINDLKSLFGASPSGQSAAKAKRGRPLVPPAPVPRAGLG